MDRKDDKEAIAWAKKVKQRDEYICQLCGKYGVYLHSHHLNSYSDFEKQRYDLNNGVTLCHTCHSSFHDLYGKGHNTKFQFLQFIKIYKTMKEILVKNNDGQGSSKESSVDEDETIEENDE